MLATMRGEANDPRIDVLAATPIDLGDGWRFIVAEIGTSTFHFGIAASGTFVLAAPPGQPWRRIGPDANGAAVALDPAQRDQGWPRLMYQNRRGNDQAWNVWRWNGHAYVHHGRIGQ